jgi:error-prone DNA polymerase
VVAEPDPHATARHRRQALWEADRAAEERPERFAGITAAGPPPTLPGMSDDELTIADLWSTGISTGKHPVEHVRTSSMPMGSCPRSSCALCRTAPRSAPPAS